MQLNWDATFGFCRADIDMIALSFCSFGGSNNPVCFSYIPHQTEGEKLYMVAFFEMQQAVMAVLKDAVMPCSRRIQTKIASFSHVSEHSNAVSTLQLTSKVKNLKSTSYPLTRPSATNFTDGHASPATCLAFLPPFAAITLQV